VDSPSSLTAASPVEAYVDLGDLELARGTAGHLHGDGLVAFAPEQRAPHGRLVGELVLLRLGLGGANDRVLDRLAGFFILDVHDRADLHHVGRQVFGLDNGRHAQLLLQLRDTALDHRLLVLRVVVLRVLGDVSELARLLDALGDLATLVGG
jgi:hypothetical protein